MIKHIVLFTLKDPANAPKVKALLDSCKDIVPGIREFEVGIKTEGLEATADVVLVSTFDDAAALAAYPSPGRRRPDPRDGIGPPGARLHLLISPC